MELKPPAKALRKGESMVLERSFEKRACSNTRCAEAAHHIEVNRTYEEMLEGDPRACEEVGVYDIASHAFGRKGYDLIAPLYDRVLSTQAAPELFEDKAAEALIRLFSITMPKKEADSQSFLRAFAQCHYVETIKEYLQRHPRACVIDLGCGMDTLFYQFDDRKLRWINIDFEKTLRFRNEAGFDQERCVTQIACDPSDTSWFGEIALSKREGLIVVVDDQVGKWTARAVKELVLGIREHFPGSLLMLNCSGGKGAKGVEGFHLHDLNAKSVFHAWLDDTTTRVFETVRIPQEKLRHIKEPARKELKRFSRNGSQILVDIEYC